MYYDQSILRKELYEAPSTIVMDVKYEGIICLSPAGVEGIRDGYGDAFEDLWL